MDRTERFYKIEVLIRSRRPEAGYVSFVELMNELGVSRATLRRDLEYLRERMNAPIVYDRYQNGYKFDAQSHDKAQASHELPGVWFSERELYSLLMANQLLSEVDSEGVISRHLQPLLDRIHQMLGTSEAEAKTLLKRVKIISSAKRPVPSQFFELVGEALLKRKRLQLRYLTRGRGEVSERAVSPQRLVHYRATWYLDGWCHTREKLLRFALDAIEHAVPLDARAKDVSLKQVEAEMDSGYGIYAGAKPHWVTLAFSPQAAQWVGREEWHADQRSKWLEDGRFRLEVPYTDPNELAMDILRHADQVSIIADTGTIKETVRKRTQQAWEMHCAGKGEK